MFIDAEYGACVYMSRVLQQPTQLKLCFDKFRHFSLSFYTLVLGTVCLSFFFYSFVPKNVYIYWENELLLLVERGTEQMPRHFFFLGQDDNVRPSGQHRFHTHAPEIYCTINATRSINKRAARASNIPFF